MTVDKLIGNDPKQTNNQGNQDDWEKLTEGKYKSGSELAKAYKDLEKKLGETSEEIKSNREFAQVIQPILEEIRNDPDIFNKLDKKIREKQNPDEKDNKDTKKDETKQANQEVRDKMSDLIVVSFEDKHDFAELSTEDQTKLRNDIGKEILEMTGKKLADIDLRAQATILEKAYKLVNANKKQTPSDETDDAKKQNGIIGKIKSSQLKGESVLNSEEATVASRLGLTREQYLAGKKK